MEEQNLSSLCQANGETEFMHRYPPQVISLTKRNPYGTGGLRSLQNTTQALHHRHAPVAGKKRQKRIDKRRSRTDARLDHHKTNVRSSVTCQYACRKRAPRRAVCSRIAARNGALCRTYAVFIIPQKAHRPRADCKYYIPAVMCD